MTPAVEALLLPSAKLTPEEIEAVNKLEKELDEHIRANMEYRGIDWETRERRLNVMAELQQRIKDAGYTPQIQYIFERHRFNAALNELVGFKMTLGPSDEAYRQARKPSLL